MKKVELKLDKNRKDDLNGVFAVSIVNEPAMESYFVKLSKIINDKTNTDVDNINNQIKTFCFSDEKEQRIITGAALIPDKPIYRDAQSLGGNEDGYVYFSSDTIKDLASLFLSELHNNDTTLEHQNSTNDMTLFESWIITDPNNDKSKSLNLDLPCGTWMLSYKVNNLDLWQQIKEGKYNGFSIEANMIANVISKFGKQENNDINDQSDLTLIGVLEKLKAILSE